MLCLLKVKYLVLLTVISDCDYIMQGLVFLHAHNIVHRVRLFETIFSSVTTN